MYFTINYSSKHLFILAALSGLIVLIDYILTVPYSQIYMPIRRYSQMYMFPNNNKFYFIAKLWVLFHSVPPISVSLSYRLSI